MKKLILGLLVLGLTTQIYAQVINDGQLPEIMVHAVNYKYLNSVNSDDLDLAVKKLELEVANFDYKNSEMYHDDYGAYSISFYIPNGKIVAAYDNDGRIVKTIERYSDVAPPKSVRKTVTKHYPGWTITDDIYKVSYHQDKGITQTYKLLLKNGKEKVRIMTDANGKIL
jgi:hypothetical protein